MTAAVSDFGRDIMNNDNIETNWWKKNVVALAALVFVVLTSVVTFYVKVARLEQQMTDTQVQLQEIRSEVGSFRSETHVDIGALRAEEKANYDRIQDKLDVILQRLPTK
jgi:predicted negative regulator of RcsB-dependent stress response